MREGSEKPKVTEEGETEADGQDVEEQSCSSHSEPSISTEDQTEKRRALEKDRAERGNERL